MSRQAVRERAMILDRFLSRSQLSRLATEHDTEWFERKSVNFKTEPDVQRRIASTLSHSGELEEALNSFELQKPVFPWFFGNHYTVEWSEQGIEVRERGSRDESTRDEVEKEIVKVRFRHKNSETTLESLVDGVEHVSYFETDSRRMVEREADGDVLEDVLSLPCVVATEGSEDEVKIYRVAKEFAPLFESSSGELDEGYGWIFGWLENLESREMEVEVLQDRLVEILDEGESLDFGGTVKSSEEPVVILFLGAEGVGKTTTVAKVARYLQERDIGSVLLDTNPDTLQAEIERYGREVGLESESFSCGSEEEWSSVTRDALEHARETGAEAVLVDTPGVLSTSEPTFDFLDYLSDIKTDVKPDLKVIVGEGTRGEDTVNRIREFDDGLDVDGIVLTKADRDIGTTAITSLAAVQATGKPILFYGTGREYDDLWEFNAGKCAEKILDSVEISGGGTEEGSDVESTGKSTFERMTLGDLDTGENSIEREVTKAYPNDTGRGIARMNPDDFVLISIDPGDIVAIEGDDVTAAKVWRGDRKDWKEDSIRIDGFTRMNADVSTGDEVNIQKIEPESADRVVLKPPEGTSVAFGGDASGFVKRQIVKQPIVEGDVVAVMSSGNQSFGRSPGRAIPLIAVETEPEGAVLVTEDTEVVLKDESERSE